MAGGSRASSPACRHNGDTRSQPPTLLDAAPDPHAAPQRKRRELLQDPWSEPPVAVKEFTLFPTARCCSRGHLPHEGRPGSAPEHAAALTAVKDERSHHNTAKLRSNVRDLHVFLLAAPWDMGTERRHRPPTKSGLGPSLLPSEEEEGLLSSARSRAPRPPRAARSRREGDGWYAAGQRHLHNEVWKGCSAHVSFRRFIFNFI